MANPLRAWCRCINGPIRLVTLLGLFSLMFVAVDRLWVPLEKMLGKLLIPLGQNSLYVYIIHVPLTLNTKDYLDLRFQLRSETRPN